MSYLTVDHEQAVQVSGHELHFKHNLEDIKFTDLQASRSPRTPTLPPTLQISIAKMSASADDQYEQQNAQVTGDIPAGDAQDNDYTSRTGQKQAPIPVQSDNDTVEDPIDPNTADSDAQLEKDDADAIDESNIVDGRTRGAAKTNGTYCEPGDEEGLPGPEDGTSQGRQ